MIIIVKELESLLKLREISSTNEKIAFLSEFKGNLLIERLLQIALDNSLVTNLAIKKLSKKLKEEQFSEVELLPFEDKRNSIFTLLDYVISEECSGTDENIYKVQKFLSNYEEEERNLLIDFIIKKPRIGVSVSNANKAIPEVVVDFKPMAAYNINKVDRNSDGIYYATLKLDGHRCLIKNENGILTAYSRNGKVIKNCNEFLNKLNLPQGYYFDGELLATGEFNHSKERFLATSVLLNSDAEINPESICYNIFDLIPIEEFHKKKSKMVYSERRVYLDTIENSQYQIVIQVLGIFKLNDEKLTLLFEKVIEQGNEGLMLNNANGLYQCKRTKDILKVKSENEIDLRCVDVLEGQGKFENSTGSLAVEYKNNIVKIPSMKDELRDYFWNNKEQIIGKIITVKYCEETQNKDGQYSLRFPRFVGLREDKNEPSFN